MSSEPSGPSRPIADCLDEATLRQLLDLDDGATGLMAELVGLFKEDTPSRLAGLDAALAAGDAQATAELAHALKGASGTIGASRMRGLAQDLEKAGKAGNVGEPEHHRLEELKAAYTEACAALDAYLAES